LRTVRFGLVGAAATLAYLAVAIGLTESGTIISAEIASSCGIVVGILVSYFGHHRITFGLRSDHPRYLPRFLLTQLCLTILFAAFVHIGSNRLGLNPTLVFIMVAVAWPICSFVLFNTWVFRRRSHGDSDGPGSRDVARPSSYESSPPVSPTS
jgi:putative flippase GtrA